MPVIKTQKVPKKVYSSSDLLASFCYHFPQYTFAQAKKLPYRRIVQMLKIAEKEHAKIMFDLTRIAAAPHSKKGAGVKKLLEEFRDTING